MSVSDSGFFFEFSIPYLDIPVKLQGTSLREKIETLSGIIGNLPHELGHAVAMKYYLHYRRVHICLQSKGAYARGFFTKSQLDISHSVSGKICNLAPKWMQPFLPETVRKRLSVTEYEYLQFRRGITTAAGPIASALFHTANLVQMAVTMSKKRSLLMICRTIVHANALVDEILYAVRSTRRKDDGDFGKLSRRHPGIFKVAKAALTVISGVGFLAFGSILKRCDDFA